MAAGRCVGLAEIKVSMFVLKKERTLWYRGVFHQTVNTQKVLVKLSITSYMLKVCSMLCRQEMWR